MTRVLFETLADERYVRLFAWSSLHAEDASAPRRRWPNWSTRSRPASGSSCPTRAAGRARIEAVVLLALSSAYGYALGRRSWLAGLGHDPADPAHDAAFRSALSSALAAYLEGPRTP